ncbi:MAG TPA: hypothetical protein VN372_03935 [Methanospirillum sp.]|nr:hypothetical protein [Methanospirillum sp.]
MILLDQGTQAALIIIGIILMAGSLFWYSATGSPRLRVILIFDLCMLCWIAGFFMSIVDRVADHDGLWQLISFLGMAASLFAFFIGFYEVLTNPGE